MTTTASSKLLRRRPVGVGLNSYEYLLVSIVSILVFIKIIRIDNHNTSIRGTILVVVEYTSTSIFTYSNAILYFFDDLLDDYDLAPVHFSFHNPLGLLPASQS